MICETLEQAPMKPKIRVTLKDAIYDQEWHRTIVEGRAEFDGIIRRFPLGISKGCALELLNYQ